MDPLFLGRQEGATVHLGVADMRLLVSSSDTRGGLGAAVFTGAAGPWTVPHVHQGLEECFYVLDGAFTFRVGARDVDAGTGAFLMVPRGTPHVFTAHDGGGSVLVLWTPAGLEELFLELGRLSPESITDPAVRAEIGSRHDSVPV